MHAFPLSAAVSAAVLAAVLALSPAAGAQSANDPGPSGSGRAIYISKDRAAGRVVSYVYRGQFSFVRIEAREPGAALNEHPFAIEPAALRAALAAVTLDDAKKTTVLGEDELAELVPPLAQALERAGAEQDVSFAVAGRYGFTGPLAARSITTARVFRRDGRLQVIFGLVRNPFESQFRATGYLLPFDPGQRSEPVDRGIRVLADVPAGTSVRADWVALDLAAAAPSRASAAPTAQAAAPQAPSRPASAPAAPVPAGIAPPPVVEPTAPRGPANGDADTIAARAAERLKALKKLREQGLISDQEYQDKRTQILREL